MCSKKVVIFGGGKVGMSAAYAMLLRGVTQDLVLFSRDKDKMKAEQLEFEHSLTFLGSAKITATNSYEDLRDSSIIVFTAGAAQQPGETRLDLVKKNTDILNSTLPEIVKYAPDSIILMVTNPVDILTLKSSQITKFPTGRIFGTGTSLDSARFRFHLSEFIGINPKSIHAYILGEHGDSSFPTISSADIGGVPLPLIPSFSAEKAQQAFEKARDAAYAIIAAKGATYYAIGVVVMRLVSAMLRDTKQVFPVSIPLHGEYGYTDVALSVPCVIGKNGVERILQIPLSQQEKEMMDKSVAVLKKRGVLDHLNLAIHT